LKVFHLLRIVRMHYFRLCLFLLVCCVVCTTTMPALAQQQQSLMSFKQYVGQMPQDLLKQEPFIGERLAKMLGKEYPRLQERFNHQSPIQLVGDVLILLGEKPFAVGNPKVIVGIGISTNKLHCAMMESNSRSIFSEDPQKIPNEFNSFMVKKDINDGKKKKEKEGTEKKN
jgi:hypothetical protein